MDIFPAYSDFGLRILFWDDEVSVDLLIQLQEKIDQFEYLKIYPANIFVTSKIN